MNNSKSKIYLLIVIVLIIIILLLSLFYFKKKDRIYTGSKIATHQIISNKTVQQKNIKNLNTLNSTIKTNNNKITKLHKELAYINGKIAITKNNLAQANIIVKPYVSKVNFKLSNLKALNAKKENLLNDLNKTLAEINAINHKTNNIQNKDNKILNNSLTPSNSISNNSRIIKGKKYYKIVPNNKINTPKIDNKKFDDYKAAYLYERNQIKIANNFTNEVADNLNTTISKAHSSLVNLQTSLKS